MANIEYKPVWSEDGQTLSNVLVKDKLETYNVVTEWYDGTPLDDSKLDSDLVYVKYEGKYLVRNFEYGQVLQKDTMQEMRDLSSYEILLLKMGVYKHVQLNGYYEKGDTPSPINYTLSDTQEVDDGGSVVEVSGVKLEHTFTREVDASYYGVISGYIEDITDKLKKIKDLEQVELITIPKGEYEQGNIQLSNVDGLHINYGGSTIIYNSLDGNRQFYGEDVKSLKISNGVFIGRMFEGVDKDTVSGLPLDSSKLYRANTHRFITIIGGVGVELSNIQVSEYYTAIDIRGSREVYLEYIQGEYLNTGVSLLNSTGTIINSKFSDCRFEFSRLYDNYGMEVSSAMGSGVIIQLPEDGYVLVKNCVTERCWTNGFRVQGSKGSVVFEDCKSVQNARHGFSVYDKMRGFTLRRCSVENLADNDFWTGSADNDTYKIAASEINPVSISINYPVEDILLEDVTIVSKMFEGEDAPINSNTVPSGTTLSAIPYSAIKVGRLSTESENHGYMTVKGLYVEGMNNNKEHCISIDRVAKGLFMEGVNVVNKVGVDSNYTDSGKYNINAVSNNVKIINCNTLGGQGGINVQGLTSNNKYALITGCTNVECRATGIRAVSAPTITPVISNCIVKDAGTFYYHPYESEFNNNYAIHSSGDPQALALNVNTSDLSKDIVAKTLNNVRVRGGIRVTDKTTSISGKDSKVSRISIIGNTPSIGDDDVVTLKDIRESGSLIASQSYRGTVMRGAPVPDGSSVDDLLQSLRDAGIISS